MSDEDFAAEVIRRLDALVRGDPAIQRAIGALISHRVVIHDSEVEGALCKHPTIQCGRSGDGIGVMLGVLGLVNGMVGFIPDGPRKGWGYVGATIERDGRASGFIDSREHLEREKAE